MLQIANSEMFCNYKPGSRKLGKEQMMLQFNQLEVKRVDNLVYSMELERRESIK